MPQASTSDSYAALGGRVVLLGAASVEQTGLTLGRTYEFTCTGGTALVRWDTTAAVASDANFDFAVPPGAVIRAVARDTMLNVIEAEIGSSATAVLTIAEIDG